MQLFVTHYESPIGMVEVRGNEKGVREVRFIDHDPDSSDNDRSEHMLECLRQLDTYFRRESATFHTFRLSMLGTEFQQKVWDEAMNIPYGETRTYGELAEKIGEPKAARAVGQALNSNPLHLVVPCHRIVPASSSKADHHGGFAAGAWRKEWLLKHERGDG